MAARKVTISLPEELADELAAAAQEAALPVSRLVAQAVAEELRLRRGLGAVAQWEAANGAFSDDEKAQMAAMAAAMDTRVALRIADEQRSEQGDSGAGPAPRTVA